MEVVRHHAVLQKEKKQLEVAPSKNDSFLGGGWARMGKRGALVHLSWTS